MSDGLSSGPKNSTDRITDILRYWLAAVRLEEALTVRPRASRILAGAELNLRDPHGRQSYFKVPLADLGLDLVISGESTQLNVDIKGERIPYTEQWLKRIYRRQTNRWAAMNPQLGGWVGWPTIYFPHNQELATLLRLRVQLEWLTESGSVFEPPDYKQRKNGHFPPPPTQIRVSSVIDGDTALLPYSIDDRLMTHSLGVADEELADLHDVFRQADDLKSSEVIGYGGNDHRIINRR